MAPRRVIQKQALRYIFSDFNASYSELLEKANRPLMYTHRLRRILSFVEKCIEGKCPMYTTYLQSTQGVIAES